MMNSGGSSDSNHAHFANENSNSMDSMSVSIAGGSTGVSNGGVAQQQSSNCPTIKEEGSMAGEPNAVGSSSSGGDQHHRSSANSAAAAVAASSYIEDSFDNYDSFVDPEVDSDHDDYEDSKKKKKKVREISEILIY